jgi:nicotinamidase-related amidase
MAVEEKRAESDRSALIIVDMQNDFLHPDGGFAHIAREHPEANIDMPFLRGTIPQVSRLADAFRSAERPVVYVAHVVKPTIPMRHSRIGVLELALRPATAPSSSRAPGERRSSTS